MKKIEFVNEIISYIAGIFLILLSFASTILFGRFFILGVPFFLFGFLVIITELKWFKKYKNILLITSLFFTLYFFAYFTLESCYNIPAIFLRITGRATTSATFGDYTHIITIYATTLAITIFYILEIVLKIIKPKKAI